MSGRLNRSTEEIIKAAISLFKENGYENVSVNDICQKADVSRSSFYYSFSGKRDIIEFILEDVRNNQNAVVNDIIFAKNDLERMWLICDRFLTIAIEFGPELMASLMQLELKGEIDQLSRIHMTDDWLIKFADSCKMSGIIKNTSPAEIFAPFGIEIAYQITYKWCLQGGNFNLRSVVREYNEIFYNVAPEYRMSKEDREKL